jgi:hypothetical protein
MCAALFNVGLLQHTSKMKDKPHPLTHAAKYAVSASKNKI